LKSSLPTIEELEAELREVAGSPQISKELPETF
jgi:hypothetical protein